MAKPTHGGGWVEDGPGAGPVPASSRWQDLTTFEGVRELSRSTVPADLASHTESDWYRIGKYYQVDNIARWRAWKRIRDLSGGQETWLFYACPLPTIEAVLRQHEVLPYGEFFPRVFGEKALYLFEEATPAAQVALKFGVEDEGFLISCRVATGKVFHTRQRNPRATQLPTGYDTVVAPKGTDLGSGPTVGDTYAIFDPARVLIRYITHVVRPGGGY